MYINQSPLKCSLFVIVDIHRSDTYSFITSRSNYSSCTSQASQIHLALPSNLDKKNIVVLSVMDKWHLHTYIQAKSHNSKYDEIATMSIVGHSFFIFYRIHHAYLLRYSNTHQGLLMKKHTHSTTSIATENDPSGQNPESQCTRHLGSKPRAYH